MDAFLTPEQKALRQRIRAYLLGGDSNPAVLPDWLDLGAGARAGFLERALIIEEISAVSPSLGRSLFQDGGGGDVRSAAGQTVAEIAVSLGTASAILEACQRAAKEKGLFESVLMDHQKTQSRLADVFSGLEAVRLQAYRAFLLLDRNDTRRGEKELEQAAVRSSQVRAAARDLASSLLGPGWVGRNPDDTERSRS